MAERRGDETSGWDSNAMTPGTEFLYRFSKRLKHFVQKKIADDKVWQKARIVYSGKCTSCKFLDNFFDGQELHDVDLGIWCWVHLGCCSSCCGSVQLS